MRRRVPITLAVLGLAASLLGGGVAHAADTATAGDDYASKPYRFTSDWHSHAAEIWRRELAPFVGRPGVRYLEVGLFQGRSFFWVLENVATDPSSRLTGVDIMLGNIQDNLAISGAADRIELFEGRSDEVLRMLPDRYDIIYIDASHRGDDVLSDAVLAWGLLEVGGVLIFDDYRWHTQKGPASQLVLPPELRPKESIDFFVSSYRDQIDVLNRDFQLILRRRKPLCTGDTRFCSPIGRYVYDWEKRAVLDPGTHKPLDLTAQELHRVEQLILSLGPGVARISLPKQMRGDPAAKRLAERLQLSGEP